MPGSRCIPFFILLSFLLSCFACAEKSPIRPNVLLILTDDQGWGDLSLHGNPWLNTPNMDGIAKQGAELNRFYVSPVCAPTRAEILTGKYHLRTGTSWVTHRREVMRSEEKTMAEYFQKGGYRTGLIGKWHNGHQHPNDPEGQGFDYFYGFKAGHWNNYFDSHLEEQDSTVHFEGFITDALTNAALSFIGKESAAPFFCLLSYNAPHSPFQLPDAYYDNFARQGLNARDASIYGMVENLDDNIGKMLEALETTGLAKNTLVVFMTDNGPNGERFNGNMRGRKGQVYEGGVRVPCFIKWPGHIAEGIKIDEPLAGIDLLPTLAQLCGFEIDKNELDGRDFSPLLKGENPRIPERLIYSYHTEGQGRVWPAACRDKDYALVRSAEDEFELFDLRTDPGQSRDIKTEFSQRFEAMKDSLLRHTTYVMDAWDPREHLRIPAAYRMGKTVELPAPESHFDPPLKFFGSYGWANDWVSEWKKGSMAYWMTDVNRNMDYEVLMMYNIRLAPGGYGIFRLWNNDNLIGEVKLTRTRWNPYLESPDRVPRGEVYEKIWAEQSFGITGFVKGNGQLRLEAAEMHLVDDFELKALRLK